MSSLNTALFASFTSLRSFGVEIEGCGLTREEAAAAIRAAGVDCINENYNHYVRPHWKVVEDGSVSGGFEVVSPILSGIAGLEAAFKVANALVAAGGKVDNRCGLHVHVDARDLTGACIINATERYARHESEIDKLVPASRRNSRWAQGMSDVVTAIAPFKNSTVHTPRNICGAVYDRYRKLNLTSFLTHGTLEFRQHSGTVDAAKIVNWIVFCVQFIEDSRVIPVVSAPAVVAPVVVSERINAIGKKFAKLLTLLGNSSSWSCVSVATIASTLEISEASVPSYVSQFRDRFPAVTVSVRRGRGYYSPNARDHVAVAPQAPVAPSRPVDAGIYANLPVTVRSYFNERSLDLASA